MGCCCCCTSRRGASFFCTSVHIFIGLSLSVKWTVVTYVNGFDYDYFDEDRIRVTFPLLLAYLAIFLVLGFINFIAVERESSGILKWSMKAFVLLQISLLLAHMLLAFVFPEEDSDLGVHRFYHLKYAVINVVVTSIYYYIIWRFVYSIENGIYEVHKKRKKPKCSPPSSRRPELVLGPHVDPSAPWSSESPTTSRSLQEQLQNEQRERMLREEDELTLPLKSPNAEPQPCSSKS